MSKEKWEKENKKYLLNSYQSYLLDMAYDKNQLQLVQNYQEWLEDEYEINGKD